MSAEILHERDQANLEPWGASRLDELLTAQQLAALLQLRVSTVEAYARRGVLPSLKLGRPRRFLRSQVEQTITKLAIRG